MRNTECREFATANLVQSVSPATTISSNRSNTSTVVCQICDKKGHAACGCYNRHNEQRFPSTQDSNNRSRYRNNRGGKNSANAVLYLDSGASNHVTSNLESMQESEKSSKSLTLAKGTSQ